MSEALDRYRGAQRKLLEIRAKWGGGDSAEEDALLDEMDGLWWALSPADQTELRAEGSLEVPAKPSDAKKVED